MEPDATGTIPLACVPGAIPAAERPGALIAQLFSTSVQERAELPDGYAYRFTAETFDAVARFVGNERKCCPYLRFKIDLAGGEGPLWLRVAGPEGTRAFLDAELPP